MHIIIITGEYINIVKVRVDMRSKKLKVRVDVRVGHPVVRIGSSRENIIIFLILS
jgi:hypothetical protein